MHRLAKKQYSTMLQANYIENTGNPNVIKNKPEVFKVAKNCSEKEPFFPSPRD